MVKNELAHRRTWQQDGKEMVLVPEDEFLYGENKIRLYLPADWIDKTPVTNSEFTSFVEATGYITTSEKTGIGCAKIYEK